MRFEIICVAGTGYIHSVTRTLASFTTLGAIYQITMQIQQAIIVIMLTAVISIFIGMVSMSVYPNVAGGPDAVDNKINKLARTAMFGFVMIPWVLIVCITDLYIGQGSLKTDITTYVNCPNSGGSGTSSGST